MLATAPAPLSGSTGRSPPSPCPWRPLGRAGAVVVVALLALLLLPAASAVPIPLRGSRSPDATYEPFVPEGNPRCFDPADLAAYGVRPLPDGARAPYGLEKVVLERNPWPTHFISSALTAILLEEALNIPVEPNDQGDVDTTVWKRLEDGRSHINMEIWASSGDPSPYMAAGGPILPTSGVAGTPELGGMGQNGIFYPRWMADESPGSDSWSDLFPESYRGYRSPRLLERMLKPADVPEELWVGKGKAFIPPWCAAELDPPECAVNSDAYHLGTCRVVRFEPSCIAVLGADMLFDAHMPALITSYRLNMTVLYLGPNLDDLTRRIVANNSELADLGLYDQRTPFLVFSWLPYGIPLFNQLSRLSFPIYRRSCPSVAEGDFYGVSVPVTCDFPLLPLLKAYSYKLTAEGWENVRNLVDYFQLSGEEQEALMRDVNGEPDSWAISSWWRACGWLKANPDKWVPLIRNQLPPPPPPEPVIALPSGGLVTAVQGFSGLVLALSTILWVLLVAYRGRPEVKSSSVAYCLVMATGPIVAAIAVILITQLAEDGVGESVCAVVPVLLAIGFNCIFASAFLKTYRIYKIFTLRSVQVQRVSRILLSALLSINGWDAIIFIVWLTTDRYSRQLVVPNPDQAHISNWACASERLTVWIALLVLPKAFLLVTSVYLAFSVRSVVANFNESKFLGFALYSTFFALVFVGPFAWLAGSAPGMLLVLSLLLLLLVYAFPVSIIFLPKLLSIWLWNKAGARAIHQGLYEDSSTPGVLAAKSNASMLHEASALAGATKLQPSNGPADGGVWSPAKDAQAASGAEGKYAVAIAIAPIGDTASTAPEPAPRLPSTSPSPATGSATARRVAPEGATDSQAATPLPGQTPRAEGE